MEFGLEFAGGGRFEGVTSFNRGGNEYKAAGPKGWINFKPAFNYEGLACETSDRGALHFPMAVHQQARQMDDFAQCILTGRATPVPGEMGRRDLRILTAIYEAARTGERVPV
jgi:predicted dehydrogenase